ncbi:SIMPL domain-containing protein [Aquipseudomonas guryensis]|jgi:predicted secreted protein|uniref:SIMPL domain-containing protein n=1 Tax=Aquipseudomonas guryensis TaxID=2759165 RepID=A0A7W4DD21_9GAMM|nr:SIMPL domain-containing protein [Pseudomonas guryensis]MBB1520318.1 SIMPL domain-containing protein [Pseudomonas guryensis]
MHTLNRLAATVVFGVIALTSLSTLADEARYNQIALRAEVGQEVAHDRMYVTLYSEAQDKDPGKLAAAITTTLNKAVEQARKVKDVSVSLGNRNSYPVYEEEGTKISAWRERAEVRLESADFASLAQLSADLLGELKMAEMNFAVADATRQQSEDALIKEAVAAFKARAQLATEALGGSGYKLVSLNLNSGGFQPVMPMRAMAMDSGSFSKSAPAPQIEAGSSKVSMAADGVIEVQMP